MIDLPRMLEWQGAETVESTGTDQDEAVKGMSRQRPDWVNPWIVK